MPALDRFLHFFYTTACCASTRGGAWWSALARAASRVPTGLTGSGASTAGIKRIVSERPSVEFAARILVGAAPDLCRVPGGQAVSAAGRPFWHERRDR
jgi:hypothetical protein